MSIEKDIKSNEIIVFKPLNNNAEFQIQLDGEQDTVWVSEQQIMDMFGKARRTIGEHIKHIYKEGELEKNSTWREFRQVQIEGSREIEREVSLYNLDVVISVGYRVKSPVGIEFRKWATSKLKDYLVKGYVLNNDLLKQKTEKVIELENKINQLHETIFETQKFITDGFLSIISQYSKSFELLNRFDTEQLITDGLTDEIIYVINYDDVKAAINKLKTNLITKGEASALFGNEKDDSFRGILGSISQTVFGELAYPSIEEQAAQLLYSIIKGHGFNDGNKRASIGIGAFFLEVNGLDLIVDKFIIEMENIAVLVADNVINKDLHTRNYSFISKRN